MSDFTYPTTNKGFALKLIDDRQASSSQRIELKEKPLPKLKSGQVLIKMLAAPANPSDLVYLLGRYGIAPVDSAFVGFEGCGVVVKANAGLYGKWLEGKRVSLSAVPGLDGVWAEYAITRANYCLPIRKDISDEQASTIIVNPLTSICMIDRAIELGAKAVVINAAASQVGKGAIRYAKMKNLKTIATVRSISNVDVLEKLGADCVLLTTADDYKQQLTDACQRIKPTVLLDAVAALDTPQILHAMPKRSTAIVYGRLTENHDPIGGQFGVSDVIFKDIKIEGFWLANYFSKSKPWHIYALSKKVQKLFAEGIFQTDIYGTFNFDTFSSALDHYANNKSDGKVILKFT
ncbi:zinc-binding dehydrogenase [Moritella sp. 5]|uniref:zinc-binding dehydrogenase n=1 Tax=Moritella sp. 5 TaxID=2746231 RepID=UPI001BACD99C|nr:zinc-binding dehydrogenase [Moritella sp. 5]QUM78928.1 zinc-binding dehydrogenase [Moritella sp. 5]